MSLWDIFRCGRTRRWHKHPVMADHDDRIDAHCGRAARLAKFLFPEDHALVFAILDHDDGEAATADVPNPVKNRMPKEFLAWWNQQEVAAAERIWGGAASAPCDPDRLRLCDKLDSIMWAAWKEPRLMREEGWRRDCAEVAALAQKCGVVDPVFAAVVIAKGLAREVAG